MSGEQDDSGDYGYDLVHEVKARQIPAPRMPVRPSRDLRGLGRAPDADGDLGYDLVHEG